VAAVGITAVVLTRGPQRPGWEVGLPPSEQLAGFGDDLSGPPTRVRIPAIGIDAPLGPLHMDESGELQAPADYALPGWYEEGAVPGETGPAVIAGHLDSQKGQAIFYRLHELKPEDLILVQRGGKWLTFEVVSMGKFAKNKFPTAAVYGPTPDAQLRVITCGGSFDPVRRSYRDNVVVFAVAIG
jgi:sortase (surface protein transpeptidase)